MNSPSNTAPKGGADTTEKSKAHPATAEQKSSQKSSGGMLDKFLNGVEYVGNKLPEPFTIFLILFLISTLR